MKITCVCEVENEVELQPEYDADSDPRVFPSVLDGSFLSFTCKECGKLMKPELPVRIRSKRRKLDIFLVPEDERSNFLLGKTDFHAGTEDAFTNRIAIGFPELAEKVRIFEANLDDRAIEVLKYYILLKAEETNPDAEVFPYFHEVKGDRIVFHVFGLKLNEVGVVAVAKDRYDSTLASLPSIPEDDPIALVVKPPYVSVTNAFDHE